MLLLKCNIGRDPGGLAYRVEETESGVQVKWESKPVTVRLEDVLRPPTGKRESAVDAAKDWLKELLGNGAVAAKDVEEAAQQAGLSRATVRRASKALGIKAMREGFGSDGEWKWSLP